MLEMLPIMLAIILDTFHVSIIDTVEPVYHGHVNWDQPKVS